jgi:hypothetical protein
MEDLNNFADEQIPSAHLNPLSDERHDKLLSFLIKYLHTELPIRLQFHVVPGDGRCLVHAILRFFAFMGWYDLQNLAITDKEYSTEHMDTYNTVLQNLLDITRDYSRTKLGDQSFDHDESSPEYELICSCLAVEKELRVIVLEIDVYKENYNSVRVFKPQEGRYLETIVLLNYCHHFYLVLPVPEDKRGDRHTTRQLVGDYIEEQSNK